MKHILSHIFALAFLLLATAASAQTKVDATVLLKSGANNTQLYTGSGGAVLWGNAASYLMEGAAIDITTNTISLDIPSLTDLGAAPANGDFFVVYDVSGTAHTKVSFSNILQAVSNTISDGTNTQTLANGETLLFASTGTDGYDFVVGATDQVSFAYDFTELTAIGSVDAGADRLLIYDASATAYRYVLPSSLAGNFVLSDGTNTQTVDGGETLLFSDAANGLDVVVGATNQVTYDLDLNELTTETGIDYAADFIPFYDVSATAERKVLLSGLVAVTAENSVSIASNTAANTNIASGLTLTDYRKLVVYLDGVRQRPTTDWVASGSSIQFTFATNAGQVLTVEGEK